MDVDFTRWRAFLESKRAGLLPEHEAMLDNYIEHLESERSHDVDRFLAHQTDDVEYLRMGARFTREHVRERFETWWATVGFPEIELDTEQFFVGDDGLAWNGVLKYEARAAVLREFGFTMPADSADDDRYVAAVRCAAFFRYRDGRMCREDAYRSGDPVVVRAGT